MADMSGTWWDATTRVSSRSVQSHRLWFWIGQLISELSISNILQYGGRPPSWIWILWFWTTHVVNHAVRLPCQNLVSIQFSPSKIGLLQFYNFASLAWKCLTTSPFWGLNPLKLYVVIKIPKKTHHWVRTRHAIEVKIYQGCDLGAIARKYNQDRTIKKAQKRNILHIWGQAPRKTIAIKFGTGVDVHELVGKVWSLKFKGCKFYRGLQFGLLHSLCLLALTQ